MDKESMCIRVPKIYGEKAIVLANRLEIVNKELEVRRDREFIYIPVVSEPRDDELEAFRKQIRSSEVTTLRFPIRKRSAPTLAELLEDKLSPDLIAGLPRSVDLVGDIAIIELPPELKLHKIIVGEAIMKTHHGIRTVLAKAGAVEGTYRLRKLSIIAGESRTETVHKEHGCQYHVDLARVYFSPRLSYEHDRVASLVQEGETVIDLFAGVGPFSVLIAKRHAKVKVFTIDVNPDAVDFLRRNIRLNRVEDRVHPLLGDAREIVEESLSSIADRVIMNLPEKASEFVDVACQGLKSEGGTVHFYSFVNATTSLEDAQSRFSEAVKKSGREVRKILFSRLVRATAPYEWQAVLDAKIV
jgi:tRNA (guanine37-N1)-methyltransferase